MKTVGIIINLLSFLAISSFTCNKEKEPLADNCIKARLEIKGVCLNYTIKVLEGNIDASKVKAVWTDPSTGKKYQNVFALGNPCQFPGNINEGDIFYFTLTDDSNSGCAVCQAYRATPEIKNNILVSKTSCP